MQNNKKSNAKKMIASIVISIVVVAFMIGIAALFVWADSIDPLPLFGIALVVAVPLAVIIGVILALCERLKEIKGGEEDEASKY